MFKPKTTLILSNMRVEITPDNWLHNKDEKELYEDCKVLRQDIKRHLDNVGTVEIKWESDTKCNHCGNNYETEDKYVTGKEVQKVPVCCEEAVKDWELYMKEIK